jgi:hypothetical protein
VKLENSYDDRYCRAGWGSHLASSIGVEPVEPVVQSNSALVTDAKLPPI